MNQTNGAIDLTKGKYYKVIILFALPIFVSQLFQQLYNTIDSLIVGNFLGTNSLAAVSTSGSFIFLMNALVTGIALGAGVVISKYFGRKDYMTMRKAIHTDIAFGLVSGVIITIVGYFLSPYILKWMKTDEEVLPLSIQYFQTYFLGCFGVVMYNIFSGICNAVGNSKRPLIYLGIASALNIILDLIFIAWFKWGVWSAAIATIISQLVSAILCFLFLIKKGTIFEVKFKEIKFDKRCLSEIIRYGVPTGIQNSVIAIANVIVQSYINEFGMLAMAACGSYFKLEGFIFLPIVSFTMAITTFVSQNFGAGQNERARKGARFAIIASMIVAEVLGLIMFIFAEPLISIFDSNPEVIKVGAEQIRVESLFFFLLALSHSIAAVCRGSGRAFVPMVVMLSIWCVLRVSYLAIITHYTNDIQFVFWAYPITWGISAVIYIIYYFTSGWQKGFKLSKKELKLKQFEDSVEAHE